jgi:hypothetical protein
LFSGLLTLAATLTQVSITFALFFDAGKLICVGGVIEDARFKRQEALADLAAAVTKGK